MKRDAAEERILRCRSPAAIRFFEWQFARQLRRHFTAMRLAKTGPLPSLDNRPVVIYSNHASWWDAIVYFQIARTLLRTRISYGPIDAAELQRYPFLDRLGIFGIDPNNFGGAAHFLGVSRKLLAKPNTMLWITAEGHFTDPRPRPIKLRPGIAHLATAGLDIVFLPLAIEYTFWNARRPELLLRFGTPVVSSSLPKPDLLHELEISLAATMDALAADAITRDDTRFDTLLDGRGGIHPLYDLLRRRA